ncbi:Alkbh3, partial [Symbiodinium microadriaticum]
MSEETIDAVPEDLRPLLATARSQLQEAVGTTSGAKEHLVSQGEVQMPKQRRSMRKGGVNRAHKPDSEQPGYSGVVQKMRHLSDHLLRRCILALAIISTLCLANAVRSEMLLSTTSDASPPIKQMTMIESVERKYARTDHVYA